jgi:hypothetical protein
MGRITETWVIFPSWITHQILREVTFTEKKNTLKARFGVLWNKKIAYRHRAAYIEVQEIARDTH